jgi:RimJ/RimL family protein N-acetyltransferase
MPPPRLSLPASFRRRRVPKATLAARRWTSGLPILRRGAVTLREIEEADGPAIVALYRLARVRRHMSQPFKGATEFDAFLEWSRASRLKGRYAGFAIHVAGTRKAVGMIYAWVTARGVAELGYALHPSVWGRGVFMAAARAMCDFAFGAMDIHRLEMRVAIENHRAQAATRKLGATVEGTLRDALITERSHGDAILFSLLSSDRLPARSAVR